jgi:hypothetical protein
MLAGDGLPPLYEVAIINFEFVVGVLLDKTRSQFHWKVNGLIRYRLFSTHRPMHQPVWRP